VRASASRLTLVACSLFALPSLLPAQSPDPAAAMHWRSIGPVRAGRGRSMVGVPTQPNVFYAGFDNGGVWRTTDFGSTWKPLFDKESTGSIGAIAVAPSNPSILYVGTGAGIIRPDLAVGDGMYRSNDAGKSWTHLGLRESQMIAWVEVDPKNPERLFVAALGHPYGPNAERGIFRSTDGGASFQKVLYKDEYTSGNDVRIDPTDPNIVYAALWQQQQQFIEGRDFSGPGGGIFKSTDGGTTWRQLTEGLPTVGQANLAMAPSNHLVLYATVAPAAGPAPTAPAGPGGGRGGGAGSITLFKSVDGGEHWFPAQRDPNAPAGAAVPAADPRPLGRIGGGDLPTITVDPTNENVVYSASTVFWRTEDGGRTWAAVRGAPGGDDYQRSWINPLNPNIIGVVADQGAVISGNRGQSWSNWYTQSTAAMYHVTADNAYPYRLCGGQQDSGSACVASWSSDGIITFHDWHPVNIQEYGIAAPDPRNPDIVFGSSRSNVSRYDRKTGQTTNVGPDMTGFNRNVRTMPLLFSPVNPDALFYASNAVWKTLDRGHSWTRISPDLSRQSWEVPATAGKYASTVTPAPLGTITALAASPRSVAILWAGTDDGLIQVTMNGGTTWTNVTPPAIKPWTRIFNIEAGHFDNLTAYAAANTLRIDDLNPHFWRTHDGGKTWQEINTGIAPGAVVNSIREDPRVKGLLYGATDTQVWVSFDDGDHWQSLRLDMPAISVRDIKVKDDSTCHCADLVAGTHGRGFWILDNLTPLREAAALRQAAATQSAHLVKPMTAVRLRNFINDPTPWPPEVPAGESGPVGAVLDYFLPKAASGPVTLEILDATGAVVRTYASTDPVLNPDPVRDPAAYVALCQRTPNAQHCAFPLYWPAASTALSAEAGMHRWLWDMHYDPIVPGGGGGSTGAVPGRMMTVVGAPWAPPGRYVARLTVDGAQFTEPFTLRLDPRVTTPAPALTQLFTMTRTLRSKAVAARAAWTEARALSASLAQAGTPAAAALKGKVDSLAPAPVGGGAAGGRGGGGRGGAGAGATPPATLDGVSNALHAAALAMQGADVAPTANQLAAAAKAEQAYVAIMARWTALKAAAPKR
jgi:photosystem II stability/assembly factor-like uncharacterized protein